ncbi:uncharacterized protein RJT21DRAFT_54061 [Scheffersomyces amazonensis]|uniref:uncharacterized protein n=1 Tax=Scheffersomyces amazonensis TaxID=1078765 RepID=UPI00315D9681
MSETYPWTLKYDNSLNQYYYINNIDQSITFDLPCEVNHTPYSSMSSSKGKFLSKLKRNSSSTGTVSSGCLTNSNSNSNSNTSVLSKISSVLSLRSSKSHDSTIRHESIQEEEPIVVKQSQATIPTSNSATYTPPNSSLESSFNISLEEINNNENDDNSSIISGLDDEYLINNYSNFRNFAGTSLVNSPSRMTMIEDYDVEEEEYDEQESINSYESEFEEEVHSFYDDYNTSYIPDDSYYYYHPQDEQQQTPIPTDEIHKYNVDKELERRDLRLQILKELY